MRDDRLVSCLTVTLPRRFAFLKQAVASYCAQTHPAREMLIVLDPGPAEAKAAIADHVAALRRPDIRIVEAPEILPLGALRNFARMTARGRFHCQWDDDDLYHPERIEHQLAALEASGAEAVCLEDTMQFFPATRRLYWTNWRVTPPTVMPGTLLCRADAPVRYLETGPDARLGEDTDVCKQLLRRGTLTALAGAPHLFVYVSHGGNSWDDGHHTMLAEGLGISSGLLRRREAVLRAGLKAFDFGADKISVRGSNGEAFVL